MDISEVKKNLNKLVIYQPTKESTATDYYLTGCILRRDKKTRKIFYQAEIKDAKANSLQCEVEKPLGYIVLFSEAGAVVGNFIVDGKVSSLNSYLFPAQTDYDWSGDTVGSGDGTWASASSSGSVYTVENPGIDGAYGQNVTGIFFFTTDGKYIEWTGDFLYSDIPFKVDKPVLNYKEGK